MNHGEKTDSANGLPKATTIDFSSAGLENGKIQWKTGRFRKVARSSSQAERIELESVDNSSESASKAAGEPLP